MAGHRFKKQVSEIPYEIVEDILARLSLKQLAQFRCVCRRWGRLIVDEQFIKKYQTHAPRKFLSLDNGKGRPCSIIYQHGHNGQPEMIVEVNDLVGKDKALVNADVAGHCNGLFCLRLRDGDLAVWNPYLKQLRRIISPGPPDYFIFNLIGFGYDQSIDDYKIIVSPPMSLQQRITTLGEIFTLKSGSRVIDLHSKGYFHAYTGTLAGRYLFWLANPNLKTNFILCFDLVSETFKELPCPPRETDATFRYLGVINGQMCIFHMQKNKIVAWGRNENADISDTESWSKWFTMPFDNLEIPDRGISWRFPKHYGGATELLVRLTYVIELSYYTKLFTCNFNEYKFAEVKTDLILHRPMDELYDYVETLVSPFSL